jgi:hypothetical protein
MKKFITLNAVMMNCGVDELTAIAKFIIPSRTYGPPFVITRLGLHLSITLDVNHLSLWWFGSLALQKEKN